MKYSVFYPTLCAIVLTFNVKATETINMYVLQEAEISVNSELPLYVIGDFKADDGIIKNNGEIFLSKDFENNADNLFDNEFQGTVIFNRTTGTQKISGSAELTNFYNLQIDNSHSGLELEKDIFISNNLSFIKGTFDIKNNHIEIGTNGQIVNETEANRIFVSDPSSHNGTVKISKDINSTEDFTNPGKIGIGLKPDYFLGEVTIIRGHKKQQGTGNYNGNYSIARYFDITSDNSDIATEMKFYFWDSELTLNHPKYELIPYRYHESWTPLAEAINAEGQSYVEFTTPGFSKFTLGSLNAPLPVEFLYFTAEWGNDDHSYVKLEWETATEQNSDYFEIQRTTDAGNVNSWEVLGRVPAAGFSVSNIYYTFNDDNPPYEAKLIYYRLKQVDFDNTYDYSNIAAVILPDNHIEIFSIYPNPTESEVNIKIVSKLETKSHVKVFDMNGQKVYFDEFYISRGKVRHSFDISHLPAAAYIVILQTKNEKKPIQKQLTRW